MFEIENFMRKSYMLMKNYVNAVNLLLNLNNVNVPNVQLLIHILSLEVPF